MKVEIDIDIESLAKQISQDILKELKPLVTVKHDAEKLYTVKTLAEYLGVSKQWVYERVKLKQIPHMKIVKFPRFKKIDIDKWLQEHSILPANTFKDKKKKY